MTRRSISRILTGLAEADPDRVVAFADEGALTAVELDRESNRLARAYRDLGVGTDDLVTVSLPNSLDAVVVCAAIWKAGAIPQPVSTQLSAEERAAVEQIAAPALVVGAASDRVPWRAGDWRPDQRVPESLVEDRWASSWKAPTSSGSTGRPKVVLASGPALLDPEAPVAAFLPREGVQLVSGPLMHSATFTYAFRGLMTGQTLVILPRFEASRVLEAIECHRVTWTLLVPTTIRRLLSSPLRARTDVSSLEAVLHLGAPCAPEDKRALMDWLGAERVLEVYAGSESNGLTMIRGDEWLERPGSVGRPIGGTAVRILRDDGSQAGPGEAGRIWMHRGDEPAYRYLGGSSSRTPEGWDTLGDRGRVDADGWLWVLDRADDLIVRGGVTVLPVEIERALEAHPGVREAVAFGVPDIELGRAIEAVVDIGEATVDADALLASVNARLGSERRLRSVRLVREPLRNDAGKVRRSSFVSDTPPVPSDVDIALRRSTPE
ncbi:MULTISPECIES: AMP-binding protein [unclassified Rathayibacter]|uniref:AMP-binding protein n=1 Tax=unclassified Rathayibacter TaxID=2609250 RepID=UPI001889C6FF|nr:MULTISPECIES: AMP-binding protein [unclassified Rathayibacter]MBF4461044.1 AMP-binding protein [Rathayibacter sp. VKM Ac-2879]MBF4502455.1 AMP-binding protein [Rathayibacter sp. VKM Ac-2878]